MIPIDALESFASEWARFMWERSLAGTIALAILGGAWLALRRWSSPHLGSWLLLLALVPLVAPVGELWPASLPAWQAPGEVGSVLSAAVVLDAPPAASVAASVAAPLHIARPAGGGSSRPAASVAIREVGLPLVLLALWSLVAGVLAWRFACSQIRTRRLVARGIDLARHPVAAELRRMQRRAGMRSPLRLVASNAVRTPAIWGLVRPTLILPPALLERLHQDELRWVLLHELAHVRRRDLWAALFQRAVELLFFFHPAVWIVRRAVERLRECACDDAALARCGPRARQSAARAFMTVVEMANLGRPGPRVGMLALTGHRALMRTRMMRLLDDRRRVRFGLSMGSVSALLACAALALPAARMGGPRRAHAAQDAPPAITQDRAPEVRAALERAGRWLCSQQRPDGGWQAGAGGVEASGEFDAIGITGMTLLALRAADESAESAAVKASIERGLRHLLAIQDRERGRFGSGGGWRWMASHGLATLALLRCRSILGEEWRAPAESAVGFILSARNPYRGWRFGFRDGDNDSFVTSLMLLALAEARDAGLEVPAEAVNGGLGWIHSMTDPATGRTGYMRRGSLVPRLVDKAAAFPAKYSEEITAVALLARRAHGEALDSAPIQTGAELVASKMPLWDDEIGSIDYYHWYWGSAALRALGGGHWTHWRATLLAALLPRQKVDAGAAGSWPAADAWSSAGAEVYATAICTLALGEAAR